MYLLELERIVFSTIRENDPYRTTKEIQLTNWSRAFIILFSSSGPDRLPFFLDILSDNECWEHTNSIHGIKLNRRTVAKKMVQVQNRTGKMNPLDATDRFLVACWCCLEEDIIIFFETFKLENKINEYGADALKRLVNTLSKGSWSDPLTKYWSHVISGYVSELKLEGKHLYEYGLDLALRMYRPHACTYAGYVEAVEFFWSKINLLPEDVLCTQYKNEICMRTLLKAASKQCFYHPEIFEFCISQVNPVYYPEFLRKEFAVNQHCGSLSHLHNMLSFELFQKLFDSFSPHDISEDMYRSLLISLKDRKRSEYYTTAALNLFLHIWQREGFDWHRAFVLRREMIDANERGILLVTFAKENRMEPVWAMLDKANPEHINVFTKTKEASIISSVLETRGDRDSLNKFLSYKFHFNSLQNPRPMQINPNQAHFFYPVGDTSINM